MKIERIDIEEYSEVDIVERISNATEIFIDQTKGEPEDINLFNFLVSMGFEDISSVELKDNILQLTNDDEEVCVIDLLIREVVDINDK